MNKEQWKKVKLGELCKTTSGGTPSSKNSAFYEGGTIPWIKSGELKEKYINKTEQLITDLAVEKSSAKFIPKNSVLIAMYGATVGQVSILKIKATTNQAICSILPNKEIIPEFLYYTLTGKKAELMGLAVGGAQPNISQQIIKNISLPLPPLETQRQIVSELDLLSTLITKKNGQLKELDKLAQSTFYDMFGDPMTNEKGWEVKKLGEICELKAGGDKPKDFSLEKTEEYHFPICANGTENRGIVGYSKSASINYPCITISGRGTIGFTVIHTEPFTPIVRLIVAKPNNNVDLFYFKSFIDSLKITSTGNTIPQLTVPMVKNIFINIPPLSLQQTFAEKIEAIEKQKALIKQSITEVQTLLDATMDKYFG